MPRTHESSPRTQALLEVLGVNLRQRRQELSRSIEDVAISVGMSRNYLSEIETATKAPSLPMLVAVAAELEVEVWQLLRPRVLSAASANSGENRGSDGAEVLLPGPE